MIRVIVLTFIACLAAACGNGFDDGCTWEPSHASAQLDLRDRSHRLHLMDDAISAEDRAVRYADRQRGHRSGHFVSNAAYRQTREECMAMVFAVVANRHGVTAAQVRDALAYRRSSTDFFVVIIFGAFYIAMANAIIRRMVRSAPADSPWLRIVVAGGTACATAVAGLLLFILYTDLFEMLRIGNAHMSYRVGRGPWRQHQGVLLSAGLLLGVMLAWYHHARDRAADGGRYPGSSGPGLLSFTTSRTAALRRRPTSAGE